MNRKYHLVLLFLGLSIVSLKALSLHSIKPMVPSTDLEIPLVATVANATVFPNGAFCVDISVADFTDIVSLQFSMGWTDTDLQFDSIVLMTAPFPSELQFGESLTSVGLLTVSGNHPFGLGSSVPDETVLFRLCFTVIGDIGECSTVAFTGFPLGIEVTQAGSGGMDIGLDPSNGTVCIVEPLSIDDFQINEINCASIDQGNIELDVVGGKMPYSYNWTGPNNFSAITEDLNNLTAGTYQVTINDASDPALSIIESFSIVGNFATPVINIDTDGIINCFTPSLSLNGSVENNGDPFTFEWITSNGHFESGTDGLQPIVDQGGTYQLIVQHESSFCTDTMSVEVLQATQTPTADSGGGGELNCLNESHTLDGSGSSTGNALIYEWSTPTGQLVGNINSLQIEAIADGVYQLLVSDTINGCKDSSFVIVTANFTSPEIALVGDTVLDCKNFNLLLEAQLLNGVNSTSFAWNTIDGSLLATADSLKILAIVAGTYQFVAINEVSFCTDTAALTITIDTLQPIATILGDPILNCVATTTTLSAQPNLADSVLQFTWSSVDGNFLSDSLLSIVDIDQEGTYQLVIQNENNGCTAVDEVQVILDNSSLSALAVPDYSLCENFTTIGANLPTGTTGVWTSLGDAFVANPEVMDSDVDGMIEGNNVFVWTLSTPTCPDYDADTLTVNVETLPIAQDDGFLIPAIELPQTLNLISNDGINVTDNWMLQLQSNAPFGILTEEAPGFVRFDNPDLEVGSFTFTYELCNTVCPNLCDSAQVFLTVEQEVFIDTTIVIPSGITPNDDGVNDVFIIPSLTEDSDEFPNNELVVFNRWGDVVYSAKPYNNNWDGRTASGAKLPEGSYYYVLRLSLSKGRSYQGVITILR